MTLPEDTDFDFDSPHHTLGKSPTQAAAGNHVHSKEFLELKALRTDVDSLKQAVAALMKLNSLSGLRANDFKTEAD